MWSPRVSVLATLLCSVSGVITAELAGPAPSGCNSSYTGPFHLALGAAPDNNEQRRDILVAHLSQGVLQDSHGGIGTIASNRQFQFQSPPQEDAVYTNGWSVCKNGSIALGGSNVFYTCPKDGSRNVFDRIVDSKCQEARVNIFTTGSVAPVSEFIDGQVRVTDSIQPWMYSTSTSLHPTELSSIRWWPSSSSAATESPPTQLPLAQSTSLSDTSTAFKTSVTSKKAITSIYNNHVHGSQPPLWGPDNKDP